MKVLISRQSRQPDVLRFPGQLIQLYREEDFPKLKTRHVDQKN